MQFLRESMGVEDDPTIGESSLVPDTLMALIARQARRDPSALALLEPKDA